MNISLSAFHFSPKPVKRIAACCLMATFVASGVSAQILKNDTITVVKNYRPQLADAVKYRTDAPLPTPDTSKQNLAYTTNPKLMNLPYVPATLRPVAMSRETDNDVLQNNYVKAGFGSQFSPLLDVHLSNGRSEKLYYALNLFHHSADGADKFKNFADNRLDATVKFPGKKIAATLQGGYDGRAVNYYAHDAADVVLQEAPNSGLRQRFSAVNADFVIENSVPTKSGISYRWSFGDRYFFTNRNYSENGIHTDAHFGKTFLEKHSANLDLGFQDDATTYVNTATNYWFVPVHPYYEFQQDNYFVRAGLTVVAANKVLVYPDLYGQIKLLDGQVVPFVQANGATTKYYISRLSEINPWVSEDAAQAIGKYIDLRGGVKGSFGSRWAYALNIGYRFYDYLPIFKASEGPVTRFNVDYEEKAGELNPHAEVGFRLNDKAALTLQGDYFQYALDFGDPAYGYPDWKMTLSGDYNIGDKILVKADLYALSPTAQLIDLPTDSVVNVKGWFDGNIEVVYNYRKNFGAFVSLNNLAASKYMRWYRYDTYGFNFKAGVIVKF